MNNKLWLLLLTLPFANGMGFGGGGAVSKAYAELDEYCREHCDGVVGAYYEIDDYVKNAVGVPFYNDLEAALMGRPRTFVKRRGESVSQAMDRVDQAAGHESVPQIIERLSRDVSEAAPIANEDILYSLAFAAVREYPSVGSVTMEDKALKARILLKMASMFDEYEGDDQCMKKARLIRDQLYQYATDLAPRTTREPEYEFTPNPFNLDYNQTGIRRSLARRLGAEPHQEVDEFYNQFDLLGETYSIFR